ncbi:MAG: polyphosphate polymerase domain-containing protein [Firmicutes bacterium]|nr:polyphosphate polymerase domain-containing protein [Bacillota bacterium]
MAIGTFTRYELKYVIGIEQMEAFIPMIANLVELDSHCGDGLAYPIYNIYFDTRDSCFIRRSLSYPDYKEKLRMRCYGKPEGGNGLVFLEIKKKILGTVNKRRAAMTLDEAKSFVRTGKGPQVGGYLNNQVIHEISNFLAYNEVYPAAFVGYRRMAYTGTKEKDLRVTFDTDIITRRTDLSLDVEPYGKPLLPEGKALMEVKFSRAVPLWLASAMSECRIYKTGFSKYGREYERACTEGASEVPAARHSAPQAKGLRGAAQRRRISTRRSVSI